MSSNANLPPIPVFVHDRFLFDSDSSQIGKTAGHLISVRAQQNQALQFSVLLATGALFTGLPAHAISFRSDEFNPILQLPDAQMWDCVSNRIDVFTMETLRYAECVVKGNEFTWSGKYLFTVDFVGDGFARHPEHWKQLHAIQTLSGYFVLYPQYRIQFTDKALAKDCMNLPQYKANTKPTQSIGLLVRKLFPLTN